MIANRRGIPQSPRITRKWHASTFIMFLMVMVVGVSLSANFYWFLHSFPGQGDEVWEPRRQLNVNVHDHTAVLPDILQETQESTDDGGSGDEESEEEHPITSACLQVMDDNHFLIEWIAYHYHTANLRHLVITSDPNSLTKPTPVLDRWRDLMTIEEWTKEDFLPKNFKSLVEKRSVVDGLNHSVRLESHRVRQAQFNKNCLRHLKKQNRGWVLMLDTDEFLTYTPELRDPEFEGYTDDISLDSLDEPGSVSAVLDHMMIPHEYYEEVKTPCVPVIRRQFSARESPTDVVEAMTPPGFHGHDFLTQRFRRHGFSKYIVNTTWGAECHRLRMIPNKVIIDLGRLRLQDLYHLADRGNPHIPLGSICPQEVYMSQGDSPFVANHYLGTREQFFYRVGDNRGYGYRKARYDDMNKNIGVKQDDEIRPWLKGFVATMGEAEAARLLEGVGVLVPLPPHGKNTLPAVKEENDEFQVGDVVQANYKADGVWSWGQVVDKFDLGFYNIMYTDCSEEIATYGSLLRRTGETAEGDLEDLEHIDFPHLALTGELRLLQPPAQKAESQDEEE
eukprot:Nitzschia sp. Nitz4//scaffold36_size144017//52556//54347//NITZ4_003083-RA/size144017-snap-gene-0.210-mRNA-1//-1//CDS//3329549447//1082//frame0